MGAFERVTIDLATERAEAMRRSVADGTYESADQIIELALEDWFRLQASDERRLEALRAAIKEGEDSGPGIPAEQVYAELEALIATFEKSE